MSEMVKSNWEGLWRQRENLYSSKTFKKKNFPDKFKIVLKQNKYYQKDTNRPRFVLCIADEMASKSISKEIDFSEYCDMLSEIENKINESIHNLKCKVSEWSKYYDERGGSMRDYWLYEHEVMEMIDDAFDIEYILRDE